MDNILSLITANDAAALVSKRARERRLAENLSRRSLAEKSGVTEASIKRFEITGQISFASLLKLAFVLDCIEDFGKLFAQKKVVSLDEIGKKSRARGRA
ncbi:transcriptional regulator [mine drainage metagenome]|uniref:Helix-turn-helix transcriptional regulator n=3 Tax=root TaxID=1 RepID=A0A8F3E2H1_9PROT|nr:helix-turn-helix transcriptional regulator [Ferrovum myxofaciens]KXW58662.1 hypothetical protein FEMY_08400 [Ferrovum myxofaciens]QWY75851.1 MAG: helix-turn-helix transcriptional regulator [Ferrovum myxofaciens]QWY78582.1 MAG: helix-turn-helix transcriptional regulator [Ferrovum myxofaciens]